MATIAREPETGVVMSDWNAQIIEEFRANDGVVGGMFDGKPLLLLHHRGAKTGTARVSPLMYHREGDVIHVFASKSGADTNPDWYHNVLAHPDVEIELGTETRKVTAAEITGEERDRIYAEQAEAFPQFGDYQAGTERLIPVIALSPRS